MININQLVFQAFLSAFIGIILTVLISMVTTFSQGLFWFLLILLWIIVAGVNGYLVKTKFEPLIYSAFVLILWVVIVFFTSLLVYSFSTSILLALNFSIDQIDQMSAIKTTFLITLITSLILFVMLNFGSYSIFLVKKYVYKAKPKSVEILEQEAYASFEHSSDTGTYKQRSEEFE